MRTRRAVVVGVAALAVVSVAAVLAPGGTIVVDVHRDQGGLAAFQTLFPGAARIGGTRTIDRCLAVAV